MLRIQFTGSYVNMDWIQFALTEAELGTTGIRGMSNYNVKFVPDMCRSLKVYSASGCFMGSVEQRTGLALTETLKQAGFARGIYIVRGSSLANTLRVQLK